MAVGFGGKRKRKGKLGKNSIYLIREEKIISNPDLVSQKEKSGVL